MSTPSSNKGKKLGPYKNRAMVDVIPETVKLIHKLQRTGWTVRQIVDYLNEEKIPTVRAKQGAFSVKAPKWHIRSVQIALSEECPK